LGILFGVAFLMAVLTLGIFKVLFDCKKKRTDKPYVNDYENFKNQNTSEEIEEGI